MCECLDPDTIVFENDPKESFVVPLLIRINESSHDECLTPLDPNLVISNIDGRWCVVEYNSTLYPGIICDCVEDGIQVKTMRPIGDNRFIWPRKEDRIWYTYEKVCTLIPAASQVTNRRPVFQVSLTILRKLKELYD